MEDVVILRSKRATLCHSTSDLLIETFPSRLNTSLHSFTLLVSPYFRVYEYYYCMSFVKTNIIIVAWYRNFVTVTWYTNIVIVIWYTNIVIVTWYTNIVIVT